MTQLEKLKPIAEDQQGVRVELRELAIALVVLRKENNSERNLSGDAADHDSEHSL